MYFDSCYIAKFYLNEPDSSRVRARVQSAGVIHSSFWAFAEFHAVLHRRLREGSASMKDVRDLMGRFEEHIEEGLWRLVPVTEALLRRTSAQLVGAPANVLLRTGDAVHLATAREIGEHEVWTSDRHMLAAAHYFGLTGRSV